jgi:8-oxo-dGTP pyrophosphatase MutT (NUDIX family)
MGSKASTQYTESLQVTAAREVEEETHWQLPMSKVLPLLEHSPMHW